MIRELVESGEGWSALVYRPDLLGGLPGRDTFGPFPLWAALASLGLSPVGVSIIATFLVQSLLGFLGCRVMMDLAAGWGDMAQASPPLDAQVGSASGSGRTTLLERAGIVCLCAFAPSFGWRVGFGHLSMMVGLLPFAAILALVVAAATRRTTVLLIVVAAASFVNGLLFNGVQMVVYGAVFGAPIVLGLWLGLRGRWRNLAIPLLTTIGAILLALPGFWPMLCHARSSDALRGLGDAAVTYDFVTATASDWLTSLPWTKAAISGSRAELLHHEVNYAAGPLLVLLALVPWRRQRALAVGLGLSLVAIIGFSMDITFVSRTLLAIIPPLRSFRVPNRAVLPWLLVLPMLVATALVRHRRENPAVPAVAPSRPARSRRGRGPAKLESQLGAGRLSLQRCWSRSGCSFCRRACAKRRSGLWRLRWWRCAGDGSGERRPGRCCWFWRSAESLRSRRDCYPSRTSDRCFPLRTVWGTRCAGRNPILVAADADSGGWRACGATVNTAFAAGLSSISGYTVPARRFATLCFALLKTPYLPTATVFNLTANHSGILRDETTLQRRLVSGFDARRITHPWLARPHRRPRLVQCIPLSCVQAQ